MLKPKTDRLDYAQMLKPPPGYRLAHAVGTTYSLDLEALVAAVLPLALAETPCNKVLQDPLSVLHAIRKISDKVVLFCQDGQTKRPRNPSRLLSFFEEMIVRVALRKRRADALYPSFHPKMWFLCFEGPDGGRRYRLIVLSRNLTFDRSWDAGLVLESDPRATGDQRHLRKPLGDFLDYLSGLIPGRSGDAELNRKRRIVKDLRSALANLKFDYGQEEGWERADVIPLGVDGYSADLAEHPLFCQDAGDAAHYKFHDVVVISPFLGKEAVSLLGAPGRRLAGGTCALVTRESELQKVVPLALHPGWAFADAVYVLKDKVVSGEARLSEDGLDLEEAARQDLHAKVYFWRRDTQKQLYIGSMNASRRGLQSNVELMVRLSTSGRGVNGRRILDDLFGEDWADPENPFYQPDLSCVTSSEAQDDDQDPECLLQEFCRLSRNARVVARDGAYALIVEFDGANLDRRISLCPLFGGKDRKTLAAELVFDAMSLENLGCYYEVEVRTKQKTIRRVIVIPTEGIPQERDQKIVNEIIPDAQKLSEYLMRVFADPGDGAHSRGEGLPLFGSGNMPPSVYDSGLYERMLRAAAENPDAFVDAGRVLDGIVGADPGKQEIKGLFEIFRRAANARGGSNV